MTGKPPLLPGLGASLAAASPPLNVEALLASAVQAHDRGRLPEAERGYRLLMTMAPKDPRASAHLAVLKLEQGLNAEAIPLLDHSLALDPSQAGMLTNKGNALAALGRFPEALAAYGQAIALQPEGDRAAGYVNLGVYLESLKRFQDAVDCYRTALGLDHGLAAAWGNLGGALLNLGLAPDAVEALDRVVRLRPDYTDAWVNRGTALQAVGRAEDALASFDRALSLHPQSADAWSNRSNALHHLRRFDEALESSAKAMAIDGEHADSLNNHGVALQRLGRADEAVAVYEKAVSADPEGSSAWSNRGLSLQAMGRFDGARDSFNRALALKPEFPDAMWNKALLLILLGEYEEGWKLFEARWKRSGRDVERLPDFGAPKWLGEGAIEGKRLLIHCEQGYGDTLCMIRYAPLLAKRGAQVFVAAPPAVQELIEGVDGVCEVLGRERQRAEIDLFVPSMSLPLAFGSTLQTIPADIPYVTAPAASRAKWKAKLGPAARRRIGLAWSGNPTQNNDHNRSMALATLMPLLEADAEFHSLQKDYRPADLDLLRADGRIADHCAELESFSDTAALMEEMDLVISVCTSAAHLAGALGRPLLVMLTAVPDYRWGIGRTDSPWYPTARLLRQNTTGDWSPVIAGALEALRI